MRFFARVWPLFGSVLILHMEIATEDALNTHNRITESAMRVNNVEWPLMSVKTREAFREILSDLSPEGITGTCPRLRLTNGGKCTSVSRGWTCRNHTFFYGWRVVTLLEIFIFHLPFTIIWRGGHMTVIFIDEEIEIL